MDQLVYFCERLVSERRRLGLNQSQFAAFGGVTVKTQVLYEKGERAPDVRYLAALKEAGVDLGFLFYGEASDERLLPDELALLAAYRALDVRGKAAAIGAVSGLSFAPQSANAGAHSQVVVGGSNNVHIGSLGQASKASTKKPKK